jgi:ubiquinol-cytochrome c reductase cytochrome c subunit
MKMIAASLRVLAVGLIALPLAATALAQETKSTGDPVIGKKLFLTVGCYQCHGTLGQGGGRAGPKLAPNPLPANLILRQLRRPAANMPVYTTSDLSDAQAGDIIAYLQSIKPGKAAKDIPLLNTK